MDADEIKDLYANLSFPSASAFYQALRRRGIQCTMKDVEAFVKGRSERQVIAPPPKYEGHIVAFDVNHRWAADLIAYTSRPAKSNDGTYTHVLLVQDIFSRFLMARPLKSVSDTTAAFEEILKESEDRMVDADPHPERLDTDGGPEFTAAAFKALVARYGIEHVIKDPNDLQAIATLDRAIGVLKRDLGRSTRAAELGGSWLTNLDGAIWGYNNRRHGGINKGLPADMTDNVIFSLKKDAAVKLQKDTALLSKRRAKLQEEGQYRTHVPKEGGLRRRIDANTWSHAVHEVSRFAAPGMVQDTHGRRTLTKFAKPVHTASRLAEIPDGLEPYARQLRDLIPAGGYGYAKAGKELKRVAGDVLKRAKVQFKQFVAKFPAMLRVHDGRIYSVNRPFPLPDSEDEEPRPRRPIEPPRQPIVLPDSEDEAAVPAPVSEAAKRLVRNERDRAYHRAVKAALDRGESPTGAKAKGRAAGQAVLARHAR